MSLAAPLQDRHLGRRAGRRTHSPNAAPMFPPSRTRPCSVPGCRGLPLVARARGPSREPPRPPLSSTILAHSAAFSACGPPLYRSIPYQASHAAMVRHTETHTDT